VVQHVKLDLVFDASESMRDDSDSALQLTQAINAAVGDKVGRAEKAARQQVLAMYEAKRGQPPPADSEVDLPKHELTRDWGWFNSKGIQRFGMTERAEWMKALQDASTYKGQGDLKGALELCRDADGGEQHVDPEQKHPSAEFVDQRIRFLRADPSELPGLGDLGDQHDKAPKRICIIITDDMAMCDKDEKSSVPKECMSKPDSSDEPEETFEPCHDVEGDLGEIASCTKLVKSLQEDGTQVAILSKTSSYEVMRLRNSGFRDFLQVLGCPQECFNEIDDMQSPSAPDESWSDWELTENCCNNYVTGSRFSMLPERIPAMIDEVLGELSIFDVFLQDPDGVPPGDNDPPPDEDGPVDGGPADEDGPGGHHGEGDDEAPITPPADEEDGGGSGGGDAGKGGGGGKKLAIALVVLGLLGLALAGYFQVQGRAAPPPTRPSQDVEMSGRSGRL